MKPQLFFGKIVIAIYLVLFAYSAVVMGHISTNMLRGDDWRFVSIFLEKWFDNSLGFRDLFVDHHPMLLEPLIYIANAEFFSLQRIYAACLGTAIKGIVGLMMLWGIYRSYLTKSNIGSVPILLVIYILLLYFGMNSLAEYSWPLLNYESSATYFLGFLLIYAVHHLFDQQRQRAAMLKPVAWVAILAFVGMLLLASLLKLMVIAIIMVISISLMCERRLDKGSALVILTLMTALILHSLFLSALGLEQQKYQLSVVNIEFFSDKWLELLLVMGYGLAAGVMSPWLVHYPGTLSLAVAIGSLVLLAHSLYVYYSNGLWKVSVVPTTLIFYMLFVFIGAVVFRSNEIPAGVWPLDIPDTIRTIIWAG